MTDRLKGCAVAFDRNIREDDAEVILNAIRMIKGVAVVEGNVANPNDWIIQERARYELGEKILDIMYPGKASKDE